MEKPFVTVGLPCYNVEKFISWAVKSVLAQSYTNFELIITDDGSVDRTLDILRGIRDERIILVADGENHGISYRLNQQISMAKGDIFIRMDGDDIMFPDRIEKQVNYLMEHPNVDVIGASAIIIDDSNQIIGQRLSKDILPTKPEKVINNNPFIHPTIAGRIAFFKKYHYDEELNGVEDKDLWCRGVVFSCYQNIKAPLLFYRDPLQFKIYTYIYRKKQGRKQVVCPVCNYFTHNELFYTRTTFFRISTYDLSIMTLVFLLPINLSSILITWKTNMHNIAKYDLTT